MKFAPLFDHGYSLYGDLSDEILNLDDPETLESIDDCKPFRYSHYEQLNLVSDLEFSVPLKDILDVIDEYKELLSEHRIKYIKHLIITRYKKLQERGLINA